MYSFKDVSFIEKKREIYNLLKLHPDLVDVVLDGEHKLNITDFIDRILPNEFKFIDGSLIKEDCNDEGFQYITSEIMGMESKKYVLWTVFWIRSLRRRHKFLQ